MRVDNRLFGRRQRKFLPKSADRFQSEDIPKPRKGESTILFLTSLLINLVFSYLFKFVWGLGSIDALQQTSKALYLLYTHGTPLASLNLIHPPIPIFLQLVPVPLLSLVDAAEFAGPLLSSISGAAALLILNRILLLFRIHDHFRWTLLLLTQVFPSFLFAAALGTSNILQVFILLLILWGVLLINRQPMAFLICGLGITLGFFIQYWIVGLTLSIFFALSILKWNQHKSWQVELEGWLLAFITPPLYAIGLWLLLNWLSQNDPFYFLKSLLDPIQASAIARNVGATHPYFLGWDNLIEATAITLVNTWETSLLFLFGTLLTVFFAVYLKQRRFIANLLIILSVPASFAVLIFLGLLPPWQYLWVALFPLSIILACQAYQHLSPKGQNWMMLGIILLGLASIWVNFQALNDLDTSVGERRFHAILSGDLTREITLRKSDPYWIFQQDAPIVARALDRIAVNGKILVDGTVAAPVLVRSQRLERMIVLKNLSIDSVLMPVSSGAEYVLTLSMEAPLNTSTLAYPDPQLDNQAVSGASKVWSSNRTILDWEIYQLSLGDAE